MGINKKQVHTTNFMEQPVIIIIYHYCAKFTSEGCAQGLHMRIAI